MRKGFINIDCLGQHTLLRRRAASTLSSASFWLPRFYWFWLMEDSTCLLPGVPGAVPGGVPGGVFYPGNVHETSTHPGKSDHHELVRDDKAEGKSTGAPPTAHLRATPT